MQLYSSPTWEIHVPDRDDADVLINKLDWLVRKLWLFSGALLVGSVVGWWTIHLTVSDVTSVAVAFATSPFTYAVLGLMPVLLVVHEGAHAVALRYLTGKRARVHFFRYSDGTGATAYVQHPRGNTQETRPATGMLVSMAPLPLFLGFYALTAATGLPMPHEALTTVPESQAARGTALLSLYVGFALFPSVGDWLNIPTWFLYGAKEQVAVPMAKRRHAAAEGGDHEWTAAEAEAARESRATLWWHVQWAFPDFAAACEQVTAPVRGRVRGWWRSVEERARRPSFPAET